MKFLGVPVEKMGLVTADVAPHFDATAILQEYTKFVTNDDASAPDKVIETQIEKAPFSDKELDIVFLGTGCSAASSLRNGSLFFIFV
jgi:hypothetical protein